MPPLPGVLAMLSPTQSASKSYSSTVVATSESGITNASSYYTHFAKMCEDNKPPNNQESTEAVVTSSMPSSSTANTMPSLNDISSSSSAMPPTDAPSSNEGESGNTVTTTTSNQSDSDRVSLSCSNSSSDNISSNENVDNTKSIVSTSATGTTNSEDCDTKNSENALAESSANSPNNDVVDASDLNSSNMFGRPRKILLKNVNAHIMCSLCNGYLIDATTIVECLHSFCHSCIMNYLRTDQYCPRCEMMINTTKHNNIKLDTTLQAIVYKLVPGLYEKELLRKRAFYSTRPEEAKLASPEQRGDDTEHLIFGPTDNMSLSLEYADIEELTDDDENTFELRKPKYLQCPANFTVSHLKKFVFGKFGIDQSRFTMDIMYKVKTIVLADHYKMMDVAYIYTWKRDAPMKFFFRVKESERPPRRRKPLKTLSKLEVAESENKTTEVDSLLKDEKEIKIEIKDEKPENSEAIPMDCMVAVSAIPINVLDTPKSVHIKEEDEIGETPLTPVSKQSPKATDTSKTSPKISSDSPSSDHRTEKLKITLVNKDKKSKDDDTPKSKSSSKSKSSKHSPPEPDDRKVENIKLKIDLSKQGSVTIINMSSPDSGKKEIVKPLKPEKEWKIKVKKDKERHSNGVNDKGKSSSHEKTVPPITIELGKPKSPPPAVLSPKPENDEEIKKSEFLNLIDLTPIKSITAASPEKCNKQSSNNSGKSPMAALMPPPTFNVKKPQMPPPPPLSNLKSISSASKRKSKEPMKAVPKKPKLDLANAKSSTQSQLKVRSNLAEPKSVKPGISFKLAPFPIGASGENENEADKKAPTTSSQIVSASSPSPPKDVESERKLEDEKLMPAPPPLRMLEAFKRNGLKAPKSGASKAAKSAKPTSNDGFMRPMVTTSMAQNSKVPIVSNVMGNRTPIARRYAPILPKQTQKNPFANLPGDVGGFLKNNSTEIKPIQINGNNSDIKVYGPPSAATVANSKTKPAMSAATTQSAVPQPVNQRPTSKTAATTNYLNYALFNSTKSKMGDIPLGCRTPIYTPNSPIYSPNSPQYMPNYNIPMQPTYKYTKHQTNANNYLQNILGANQQMSSLFPAPPVKTSNEQTPNPSKHDANENSIKSKNSNSGLGRPSPEPADKQTPVQSLLNSCNINIPSSLSITIRNEDDNENSRKSANMKHSSPVNNYIEILKLPDTPIVAASEVPKGNTNTPSCDVKPTSQAKSSAGLKVPDVKVKQSTKSPTGMGAPSLPNQPAVSPTTISKPKNPSVLDNSEKRPSPGSTVPAKMAKKTPSPEKKPTDKPSKKAEKRPASDMTKSPKDKFDISPSALKKFRPILPRSKTPPIPGVPLTPMNPIIAAQLAATNTKSGRGKKGSPKTNQLKNKSPPQVNLAGLISPPIRTSDSPFGDITVQRNATTPPIASSSVSLLATPPPTVQPGNIPPELAAFLAQHQRQFQQQQQQQGGPFSPNGVVNAQNFLPHLANYHPSAANLTMQRAFLMEQLARMQKAGAEALEKYMQHWRNTSPVHVKSPSGSPGSSGSSSGGGSVGTSTTSDVKNSV